MIATSVERWTCGEIVRYTVTVERTSGAWYEAEVSQLPSGGWRLFQARRHARSGITAAVPRNGAEWNNLALVALEACGVVFV
jgi:hypothetical protein